MTMKIEYIPDDAVPAAPAKAEEETRVVNLKIEFIGERPEGSHMDCPGVLIVPRGREDQPAEDVVRTYPAPFSFKP